VKDVVALLLIKFDLIWFDCQMCPVC